MAPKIGDYIPQVSRQVGPAPELRAATGGFGLQFGQELEQAAGNVLSPLVEAERKRREQLTSLQLSDAESATHAAMLKGFTDLKTKTGDDARLAAPDILSTVQDAATDAGNQDMLPYARELYNARVKNMLSNFNNSVQDYVNDQGKVALRASTKTATTLGLSLIGNEYKNDKFVADTAANVETKLQALSKMEDGGASAGANINDWYSSVGQVVIRNFLKENTMDGIQKAEKKLIEYKPQLGIHAATLEGEISTAKQKVGGLGAALKAAQTFTIPNTSFIDQGKGEQDILKDKTLDPFSKVFALEHFRSLVKEGESTQKAYNEDAFSRIYTAYRNRGWSAIDSKDIAYLSKQPEHRGTELWQRFLDITRADAQHDASRPPTEEENRAYGQFLGDIAEHPEKYADMTMPSFQSTYHPTFNQSRRVEADAMVAKLKNPAQQTEGLTPDELRLVLQYGRQEGFFTEKDSTLWSPKDELRMEAVVRDVQGKRTTWMKNNPHKKPGAKEAQEWIHEWFDPLRVLGTGIFRNDRITKLDATMDPQPYRGKTIIPEKLLNQIDEALSQMKVSHDDINREWIFRQYLQGKTPTFEDYRTNPPRAPNFSATPAAPAPAGAP
jgi:hypothetical protein